MCKLIAIIFLLTLLGCEQAPTTFAPNQDALDRVARILEQAPESIVIPPRVTADFNLPALSEARIGFANALKLGECGLVPLIAERNSALGRQKRASTRFWYEWSIHQGLNQCKPQFGEAPWFIDAVAAKADDVDIALTQVLLTGREAAQLRAPITTDYPTLAASGTTYTEAMQTIRAIALNALKQAGAPDDDKLSAFEEALKRWGQSHHHATLGLSVRESLGWLRKANQMQAQVIRENRMCPMGTPTEAGARMGQFVRTYFAEYIQPRLAEVARNLDHLEALWLPLMETNPVLAQAMNFDQLLSLEPASRTQFRQSVKTHIAQWQELLDQCDLSPRA